MAIHADSHRLDHEWSRFTNWLTERGYDPVLPAACVLVTEYLVSLYRGGCGRSRLTIALRAIRQRHLEAGLPSPTDDESFRQTLSDLIPTFSVLRSVAPLTADDLDVIISMVHRSRPRGCVYETAERARSRGLVDVALVSVMYHGMLRPGEVVSLRWRDISRCADGAGTMTVPSAEGVDHFSRSLSPQALDALDAIRPYPCDEKSRIFEMTRGSVSTRIREMAKAAGLGEGYSGHSPCIGIIRDLVAKGRLFGQILQAGRWHSTDVVPYFRPSDELSESADRSPGS